MERLSDRAIEIINELHRERLDYESEYLPLIDCANKCQAYEDTGLEPEEIKRVFNEETVLKVAGQLLGITPDRLRELAQADREGRTVSDLVRNMSDDELLELIEEIRIHCCPPLCDQNHYCDEDCHKGIAAWLNGPADERILDYLKRPKMKEGASEDTSP